MFMRNLFPLFLCGLFATACVDNDYDLSKIDTDNIAIGDETSRFEAPMARVYVSMQDLNSSDGVRIDEIFDEADTWLPTRLPDEDANGSYADVQRLVNDPSYVNDQLLPELLAQMTADAAKLDDVATLLQEKYYDNFTGILTGVSQSEFKTAFIEAYTTDETLRGLLGEEVKQLADNYLTTLEVDLNDLTYDIERIDLSDEVVNMLCDNLDPAETPDPKNTLHLAGNIDNRLPLTLQIAPSFLPTQVSFTTDIAANSAENPLPETRLLAEDLRTIVRGITVQIPVVIEKYYPGKGFDNISDQETQIRIDLHLIKRGALKFDL